MNSPPLSDVNSNDDNISFSDLDYEEMQSEYKNDNNYEIDIDMDRQDKTTICSNKILDKPNQKNKIDNLYVHIQ